MNKYILTEETKEKDGVILHRIKATRNFATVSEGDLGGWIEDERNLEHDGDCWVFDDAEVYGNADVYGNAKVFGNAKVYGNAWVFDESWVYGNTQVFDTARVYGDSCVHGNATVYGDARVYDMAKVCGNAEVYDNARVFGEAEVYGNAKVYGTAQVFGKAVIRCDAIVGCVADYQVCKNNWSSGRYFTYTRSNDNWAVGCFNGNGKALIEKAYKDNDTKGKCYKIVVESVESLYKAMQ